MKLFRLIPKFKKSARNVKTGILFINLSPSSRQVVRLSSVMMQASFLHQEIKTARNLTKF